LRKYSEDKVHHWYNDTGGKFATGVTNTNEKFATGISDTVVELPPVLLVLVNNTACK
jgi:hypothetical protein